MTHRESEEHGITRAGWWLLGISIVFAISILYHAPDPAPFTICLFRSVTSIECPGCGLTHSFCAIAKGHVAAGFHYNLLGPAFFLLLALVWTMLALDMAGLRRSSQSLRQLLGNRRAQRGAAAIFLLYGVARLIAHFLGTQL